MSLLVPGLAIPIRTIFGIGRNYAAHAKELGNTVPPEPIIFLKPLSSVLLPGGKIRLPSRAGRVDFEGEIVVVMGPNSVVAGYGLGIDVTARDWQSEAKKKGHPWALSKGCDTFAVLGDFLPAAGVDPKNIAFTLSQNGKLKQRGNTGDMETSVEGLVDYLSKYFTLAEGDLIFTGTPEGVGPMASGDKIEMEIAGTSAGLSVSVA